MITVFNKVIINVPVKLLKKFDEKCKLDDYSRAEAIKQMMRDFINA